MRVADLLCLYIYIYIYIYICVYTSGGTHRRIPTAKPLTFIRLHVMLHVNQPWVSDDGGTWTMLINAYKLVNNC
jgi:hypothetical protein